MSNEVGKIKKRVVVFEDNEILKPITWGKLAERYCVDIRTLQENFKPIMPRLIKLRGKKNFRLFNHKMQKLVKQHME